MHLFNRSIKHTPKKHGEVVYRVQADHGEVVYRVQADHVPLRP